MAMVVIFALSYKCKWVALAAAKNTTREHGGPKQSGRTVATHAPPRHCEHTCRRLCEEATATMAAPAPPTRLPAPPGLRPPPPCPRGFRVQG